MKVLVDIGNTRIKWAVDEGKALKVGAAIDHQQVDFIKDLKQAWQHLSSPDMLAVSSVSNKQVTERLIALAELLWPNVFVITAKSTEQGFSVTNAYPQANKLGIDRWLGLIALQHYYPGNSCVVDCGTAITLDVLNQRGQHLGGLISPGLQLMQRSLFVGAENLSQVEQTFTVGLADFTEAAIYSGTLYSASGLIEKSIAELCKRCETIVLTGGDAKILSQHLNFQVVIEPDFILKGLAIYSTGRVK